MKHKIQILQTDITTLRVDAIVNAANNSLLGGGGVDGAIHRAAGPELLAECRALHGCKTGQAKITQGYRLPAKYVIHTVGPIWANGSKHEEAFLADCYLNSLKIAINRSIKTIAFPSISTGIYGFPISLAAPIALRTILNFLTSNPEIEKVIIACFSLSDFMTYEASLKSIMTE